MSSVNTEWLRPKKSIFSLGRASPIDLVAFLGVRYPGLSRAASRLLLLPYEFHPTERVIEYAFVHEKLVFGGRGKVLDVGCGSSGLPLELASKGYHVVALDPDLSPVLSFVKHPNLEHSRGDIRKTSWEDGYFDFVSCISVLEHIGEPEVMKDDLVALQEMRRVLKKGGQLILTVPFGRMGVHPRQGWFAAVYGRVYDKDSLEKLLNPLFEVIEMRYAMLDGAGWRPATPREVENIDSAGQKNWKSALAVAMVVATPKL